MEAQAALFVQLIVLGVAQFLPGKMITKHHEAGEVSVVQQTNSLIVTVHHPFWVA